MTTGGRTYQKWILVVGARPNFIKIAPLIRAISAHNRKGETQISALLVHTGQHYDKDLFFPYFVDLDLPEPDINLEVGSGSHGEQTGKILIEFERILFKESPHLVIVVGDVNSTLACALAAAKLSIPVAHVEAGLRSFDRNMPEEINRILTDALADYLFTTSPEADENLANEGVSRERVYRVGNIMADSLFFNIKKAKKTDILEKLGLIHSGSSQNVQPYALLTLHRPCNVDEKHRLTNIVRALLKISSRIPILFPVHPRTRKNIMEFGLTSNFEFYSEPVLNPASYYDGNGLKKKIHCFSPMGYLYFLNLMAHSKVVITDSGGIQEETTILNIRCITLRENTERPITLTQGTNILVGNASDIIVKEILEILAREGRNGQCPDMWDGKTAKRIVDILVSASNKDMPISA